MSLEIEIKADDHGLLDDLKKLAGKTAELAELNSLIAASAETLTRDYITEVAAPDRHVTAERLGATPTGYLEKLGGGVESSSDSNRALVSVPGAIFARVNGPAEVTAKNSKYLTIPANAAAFGHSARDFADLKFIPFGNGTRALAMVEGTGKSRTLEVYFWLKESVTLPQDRELLPSDQGYLETAVAACRDYFKLN
jgi:hypothetical protein